MEKNYENEFEHTDEIKNGEGDCGIAEVPEMQSEPTVKQEEVGTDEPDYDDSDKITLNIKLETSFANVDESEELIRYKGYLTQVLEENEELLGNYCEFMMFK